MGNASLKVSSFEVRDRSENGYFGARVFPTEKVIVVVPASPEDILSYGDYGERVDRISVQAREEKIELPRDGWKLFEIKPYKEHLFGEKFIYSRKLLSKELICVSENLDTADFEFLDDIAKRHGLVTVTEYFRNVAKLRAEKEAQANEAHEMLSAWTHQQPNKELLARLVFDQTNRQHLVGHYRHGWYYTITSRTGTEYYQAENTTSLLASFIHHASEAIARDQPVRFGYCLREFTADKDWKPAPR